jgi:putative transposase
MTNHVHLIIGCDERHKISDIIRDLKKYTSVHVVRAIAANISESRKDWMLKLFAHAALKSNKHEKFLFCQQEYHPVEITDHDMFIQKIYYIHDNPVRAGIVFEQHQYVYSIAISYAGGPGLLKIIGLEMQN